MRSIVQGDEHVSEIQRLGGTGGNTGGRLDDTARDGHPQGGIFQAGAGEIRADLSHAARTPRRQTTPKTGPAIDAAESQERYGINAIGFASSAVFPDRRLTGGVRYFEEFGNRSSFQGFSLQISGAIGF
jgi:hypothetical protein